MKHLLAAAIVVMASTVAWADDISNARSGVQPRAAGFTDFTDFALFQAAFGAPLGRITFSDLPPNTVVANQFLGEGVTFTDGDDTTLADPTFVEDGIGLRGSGRIHVEFTQPAIAVGAFFPGAMTIEVFATQGGSSLHTSADFAGSGGGHFGGVIGDTGFRFVEIRDWVDDSVFIDDLVFGFAPPKGAITGCLSMNGVPLVFKVVTLVQLGEPRQRVQTDTSGCYAFDHPAPGKNFVITIRGDVVPPVGR